MSTLPNDKAVPCHEFDHVTGRMMAQHLGLTAREHSAIALRVPDSGNDWLDAMIRTAQRNDLAARFAAGLLANPNRAGSSSLIAERAAECADDMLSGAQIAEGE